MTFVCDNNTGSADFPEAHGNSNYAGAWNGLWSVAATRIAILDRWRTSLRLNALPNAGEEVSGHDWNLSHVPALPPSEVVQMGRDDKKLYLTVIDRLTSQATMVCWMRPPAQWGRHGGARVGE